MGKHRYAKSTRRFAEVPHTPCLYAAELSDGSVKVGVGTSARARMMSLANEVKKAFGVELVRFEVIPKRTVKAAYEAETVLVAHLRALGAIGAAAIPGRREYFTGLNFAVACALAKVVKGSPYRAPYRYVKQAERNTSPASPPT
jgi:alkylation response protein AidB-like acyl-CoA dehydrogenase